MVLWWVSAGYTPSIPEATQKLDILRELRPSAEAFKFKKAFSATIESVGVPTDTCGGECPDTQ